MPLKPGRDITLIVPGLFGPEVPPGSSAKAARRSLVDGLDLGALENLLSSARRSTFPNEGTPEGLVFTAFGYRKPPDADWPVAAVTRFVDVGAGNAHWCLRADPVHLKADMSDLVLFDGTHFELSLDQARQLADELIEHFRDDRWVLEVPHPLRWYLRTGAPQRITTTPLSTASANPVNVQMPRGPDAGRWLNMLNEVQMVLHQSAINDARAQRGEPAINSLWFWGGGALPAAAEADISAVFSDDVLTRGLAQLAGLTARAVPESANALLGSETESGDTLVTLERGYAAARSGDVEGWRDFISGFNQDWMVPLAAARRDGRLNSLRILSERGDSYGLGAHRWWQHFRRPRSFAELASP